ncbi:MAG: FAD-binding oxidoreductase [Patescibacteria group bacterium]
MPVLNTSPWLADWPPKVEFPPLAGDISVDVAVVGGGMNGMLTAYALAKHGVSVALVEKSSIGSGESGYTTAFLTKVMDLSLVELTTRYGAQTARQIWEAGQWAIHRLEEISIEESIACDLFRCEAMVFTQDEAGEKMLQAEMAQAQQPGLKAEWMRNHVQFQSKGHLSIPDQAKFHPRKFLTGLSKALEQRGGQLFEKTKVTKWVQPAAGQGHQLVTPQGTVTAHQVVVCTHLPQLTQDIWTPPVTSWQTYALEANGPSGILPEALFWDTESPYHYFRVDRQVDHDRIILGGADHLMGQTPKQNPHQTLKNYLAKLFPEVRFTFSSLWGGQILETPDGLPCIGAITANKTVFVGTGFSGNGMTFSAVSAQVNTHLILHGKHEWADVFDPLRFKST